MLFIEVENSSVRVERRRGLVFAVYAGLLLATALVHWIPGGDWWRIALIDSVRVVWVRDRPPAEATQSGTLVERSTRYTMLVHLPAGAHDAETVRCDATA